jgi:hypothetical protein
MLWKPENLPFSEHCFARFAEAMRAENQKNLLTA